MASPTRGSVGRRGVADLLAIPAERRSAIERLATELRAGRSVAMSTHINSDGDGCGSEVALARLLAQDGIDARIANPTPWPAMFDFLLSGDVKNDSDAAEKSLRKADLIFVLDISDLRRLGSLGPVVRE